jgi:drug/metabolite transporter (DMT)-like permease
MAGSEEQNHMNWRGWIAFAALGVIWGLPYFFIKIAVQELSPLVVAWGRISIGALILLPIAWHRGALRSVWPHKGAIVAFALAEFAIPFCMISYAERWIASSLTGILIASVPLTIALISRFFGLHERLGAWRLAGLILGFAGVASLLGFGAISGSDGWIGVGCMLLATVGYAIGPLIVQRYLSGIDSSGAAAASLVVASLVLLPFAIYAFPSHMPSPLALTSMAVLGAICTALAMLLLFYLIGHAGASRASVITYINPVVATLLGVLILHEHLGVGGITAFALILIGSWLGTRGRPAMNRA